MTFKILPYKQGSKSAKALANVLDCKVLKLKGSKYKPKPDDTIINWGSTTLPEWTLHKSNVLNRYNISDVSTKFKFFQKMSGEEYMPKRSKESRVGKKRVYKCRFGGWAYLE